LKKEEEEEEETDKEMSRKLNTLEFMSGTKGLRVPRERNPLIWGN